MQYLGLRQISLPLEIPADQIGLPTGGATVTKCTFFRKGDKEPEPLAEMFGFTFPTDVYRYEGRIHPVDSNAPDILFVVGIPVNWNGKAIQQGGGGLNGSIPPCSLPLHGQDREEASALQKGYIIFGGDSGHEIADNDIMDCRWMQNQECFENFAYLSLKKTRDAALYLIEQITGRKAERVYFYGGSNGGRECMKALQNYPGDYDGAVCFFPVLYWVLKVLMDARNAHVLERIGAGGLLDAKTCDKVTAVAMEVCGGVQGEPVGVITDWERAAIQREKVEAAVRKELSEEQFRMLRTMAEPMQIAFPLAYGDIKLPGYEVFAGTPMASQFAFLAEWQKTGVLSLSDAVIANAVMQNASCDTHGFRPEDWKDRILDLSKWLDAYNTDLDDYVKKGVRLILVQGTVDPQVTLWGTVQYYEELKARYGVDKLDEFLRFYVAPGYGHGTDGSFLITADFVGMLDQWVETGKAPEDIVVKDIHPQTAGRTQVLSAYR